jgi:ABC-type transport system involved in multi-copper enzyme maturation permease subunit
VSIGAGLVLGVRGIVGKEMRSRTRGYWRPMLQLTLYLALVTLAVVAVLGVSLSSTTGTVSPTLGETLFSALAAGSVLLIAFIAPGLTAASISGERERLTLDLLLVTRASPLGLVAGKLSGALLWIGYLVIASLPALAVVNLFGGVALSRAAAALTVSVATALAYTSLGLVLSALVQRTVLATVLAYAGVLATVIVVPILAASMSTVAAFSGGVLPLARGTGALGLPPSPAWLTFLSPVTAIISVLGGAAGPLQGGSTFGISLFASYLTRLTGPGEPREVTSLAPWAFYSLLCLLFTLVCLFVAAVAVRPASLWRWHWTRRGR